MNTNLSTMFTYNSDQINEEESIDTETIKPLKAHFDSLVTGNSNSDESLNCSNQIYRSKSNSELPLKIIPPEPFGTGLNRNVYFIFD